MLEYIRENFWWLVFIVGTSTVAFFILLFVVFPIVIRRLPANFFVDDDAERKKQNIFLVIVRNIVGVIFVVAGAIVILPMFTLPPGSGLMVIVVGIGIMEFPGKRRLLRYFLKFKTVRRMLNWIRTSKELPPFELPSLNKEHHSNP